jgi:hypothetical protein
LGIGIFGTPGMIYRLEKKLSLADTAWQPVLTNKIASAGFNLAHTNIATGFYRAVRPD